MGRMRSTEDEIDVVVGDGVSGTVNRRRAYDLQTDKGLEFLNRSLKCLLKEHGIHHFSTHNEETKASIVERFNRTLKIRMWRYFTQHQMRLYIDALHDFVLSYNDTYH